MAVVRQRNTRISPINLQVEKYSDFLTTFEVDSIKQDLIRNVNEEAVKNSIRNLLMTNRGDRLFNNTLGSDIRSVLFESHTPATEQILSDLIKNTITNYEPRARVLEVRVQSDDEEHLIVATVVFSIINKEEPVVLELILNRIR